MRFDFGDKSHDPKVCYRASINLHTLAPHVVWPLLAACYRAAIGNCDFSVHLSGQTGTFKSEVCSLIQSHWGETMDARKLPASWNSTGNSLEAIAYHAKDAVLVVDDFVPLGSSWSVRALQKAADQLLRGQGNQAGRARLNESSRLQQTMYPRGLILSTGEDIPEGHSLRARMLNLELSPGDINTKQLTLAQGRRQYYPQAMRTFIQYLASDLDRVQARVAERAIEIRDANHGIGHARTPAMLGEMLAAIEELLHFGMQRSYIDDKESLQLLTLCEATLVKTAGHQVDYIRDTNPADTFLDTLRSMLTSGQAHLRSKSGGIPKVAPRVGWTKVNGKGEVPHFKANGPLIGWIDSRTDEVYVDVGSVSAIQRASQGQLAMTKQTLFKRLKDAGALARSDETRERNTIRVICQGAQRNVIAIPRSQILPE
jgi:hypothetical protein